MLSYTMSEDGNTSHIGPCVGGFIRLSIIRICRNLGCEIPPAVLEEETDIEELRAINLELLIQREKQRQEQRQQEIRQRQAQELELSEPLQAKVRKLREQAAILRQGAARAERSEDMRRELNAAAHLEAQAKRLLAEVST